MMNTPDTNSDTAKNACPASTAEAVLKTTSQWVLAEQLSSVAQAIPGFLYTTRIDTEGNSTFPFASDGIEDLIGVRPEQIRDNAALLRSHYHPDDLPGLMERIGESTRTLAPFRYELRVLHPKHGLRWVDMRATPRRLSDGTLEAHGMMLDITERKVAEIEAQKRFEHIVELNNRLTENARTLEEHAVELEAVHEQLKTTEAWYRGILHSAPDGLLVVSDRGIIMLVNEQLTRMFGYCEGELVGQPMEVLVPLDAREGHPEKRRQFVERTEGIRSTHEVSSLRGRRRDGTEFPIDVTLSRLPDSEFSGGTICASIRDTSERKRLEDDLIAHEREYRTLADNLPAPVIRYDADGRRRYMNRAAELMFQDEATNLLGRSPDSTAPATSHMLARYRKAICDVMSTKKPCEMDLSLDALPDEDRKHYSVRFVPETLADGSIGVLAIGFDVTLRRLAEIELREREAFQVSLLNAMSAPVFFKDRQGRILGCNEAYERFIRITKDELLGKTVFDIVPRCLAETYHGHDEALYASNGNHQHYETSITNADGETRDVIFQKAVFFDAHGTPAGLIGVILDITERKAAETDARTRYEEIILLNRQLEENTRHLEEQAIELEAAHEQITNTEAWYRGVIKSAPDGMLVINERGVITLVNGELARMFGYAEAELLGRPMEMLVPPDVRGDHSALRSAFVDKMQVDRKAYSVSNLRGCRKDGSEFDVDISLSRLPATATSDAAICASIRDITERKRAEERLRQALDFSQGIINAIPDILFEVDLDGRYLNVWTGNPEVLASQKEALIGKTIYDVLCPESVLKAMTAIREADTRGVSYGNILCVPHPNGDRWYDHSLSKKIGATPSDVSFIVLSRDVTERKKIEEALAVREKEFRSLADNLPVPIFRYDRQCRRVYVNPFITQQIRKPTDALIGKTPAENHVIGPLEARLMHDSIQKVLESGKTDEVNVKFVDADDKTNWFRMSNIPEFGPDGAVHHVLSIGHNETKLHELEAELNRRAALEEQVSSLAQAIPGFLFLAHVESNGGGLSYPYASEGVVDLFGLQSEDIQNSADALRLRFHPDDVSQIDERFAESIRTLSPHIIETRINHPVKGERWVEIRGTPRHKADGSTDIHGLMLDITDKKRVEAALAVREREFRTLVENANDVVVRYDRNCRRIYMNPAWERINGLSKQQAENRSPLEISGNIRNEAEALERMLRRVIDNACPDSIDLSWHDEAGRQICYQMDANPEFDSEGAVTSVLTISRDISERKRMELAIRDGEARYRQIFDNAQEGIALMDITDDGDFITVEVNTAFVRLIGIPREMLIGKRTRDVVSDEQASRVNAKYHRCLATGSVYEEEIDLDLPIGTRTFFSTMVPVRDDHGRFVRLITITRDVTERKRMEEALIAREREFRTLVENTPDTVIRFGRDFRRLYVNPATVQLFDGHSTDLVGGRPTEVSSDDASAEVEKKLAEVFTNGQAVEFEWTWTVSDDKTVCHLISMTPEFSPNGEVESVLSVGRDISELHAFRQRIHQMAFYDTLTTLPNRALFNDRLRQMITDAAWHGHSAGVMMIDLDRFKAVNDTMGHAIGDELLRETAARLAECVRSYDTVARLGGDEFAVLLPEIRTGADLGRVASKMLAAFDERFLLDGIDVFISCSIGIAIYPDDSTDAEDLVKYADSAMYFAKKSGRNDFRFYAKELTESANKRLALESELRRAIERNELELYYQPKILLKDGTLTGSEALLRWKNPRLGIVPPDQFIQIAEDTGLIVDIGKWVLREACTTAAEWNGTGHPAHKVAINLSARQFQTCDLIASVAAILAETDCRPEWIELEITESLLLDEDGRVLNALNSFRSLGISIAIDDFGTGYSALSYLTRFPIDTLKIDRSFISTVTTDKYRAELVRAILSIARCLGQEVVAEGVETVEQALFLTAHGCHVAQGYLYSKPLPKPEATAFSKQLQINGTARGVFR